MKKEAAKLWGGRFAKPTDALVEMFTTSMGTDARLWVVDIRASRAHARMLGKCGIIPAPEAEKIIAGLSQVHDDLESGKAAFDASAEDVHSEIERMLGEKVGQIAGKLHTARSRNDQVATDTRLYLREQIDEFSGALATLQTWLLEKAESNTETLMPGLTHMQHAQPVSLAHHLLAYFWMFQRDRERLSDVRKRVNVLPLGSAAMAGTSFPIDRQMIASELEFAGVTENSLDAVSDRDFVVEFLSAASLVMMHLSRLSEELILWSMPEYAFVQLDDSVTTGSSIMPQKKNPDVAELIRGRVGRVYGQLVAALTMLKALPLSYNRDLQEDKVYLFEGLDTVQSSVRLMHLMLSTADFKTDRMRSALAGDFSNATDLADYLVRKGVPFREAHSVIGHVIQSCIEKGVALEAIALTDLQKFSTSFGKDALALLPHEAIMRARTSEGGTGPAAVREQIVKAKNALSFE